MKNKLLKLFLITAAFSLEEIHAQMQKSSFFKQRLKVLLLSLSLVGINQLCFSQNPLIKDIGMSDPHAKVFNDTIYLYTGHDDKPDDKTWVMKDWMIFSSTNLRDWKLRNIITPKDNYMPDNSTECWAGDAAERNNKYYFYFSDRARSIGVMTANSPIGPFKDPIGKPLVAPKHDPTILIDDDKDKSPYIVWGGRGKDNEGFKIAKLNEDMISLAENPKPIIITGKLWEESPAWMDKNYIFKYNGIYYISWGQGYATSTNVYGPYKSIGNVGEGYGLNEYAHGSFFWWKNQFYHVWCYYIKPGFKYRETIMSFCHIADNGEIVTDTDFLKQHFSEGVGQYSASWPVIQAEWYYNISDGIKKQGNKQDGFYLSGLKEGSWINFDHTQFENGSNKFTANVKSLSGKGYIEVRTDSVNGPLLGVTPVFGNKKYQNISCNISNVKGFKNVFLVFKGRKNTSLNLDWIRFE